MDWLPIIRDLGLPAAALVVLSWAVWKTANWVAVEVVVPIRNAHVAFLTTTGSEMTKQTDLLHKLADVQANISAMQEAQAVQLRAILAAIAKGTS